MEKVNLNSLFPIALVIITFIVIASIGSSVITSFYENQVTTVSVANESVTGSSTSYVPLAYIIKSVSDAWGYNGTVWFHLATPADYNWTAGDVTTGNKGGVIVSSTYNAEPVNVTYVGYQSTTASNISKSGINAQTELSSWTKTIAMIVAVAIIIGIILSAFAVYRTRH